MVQGQLQGASAISTSFGLGMLMLKTRGGQEQYLVPPDKLAKVPGNQVTVMVSVTPNLRHVRSVGIMGQRLMPRADAPVPEVGTATVREPVRRAPAVRRKPAAAKPARKLLADYVADARAAYTPGVVITPAWVRSVTTCARGTSKAVADALTAELTTDANAAVTAAAVSTEQYIEREAA